MVVWFSWVSVMVGSLKAVLVGIGTGSKRGQAGPWGGSADLANRHTQHRGGCEVQGVGGGLPASWAWIRSVMASACSAVPTQVPSSAKTWTVSTAELKTTR